MLLIGAKPVAPATNKMGCVLSRSVKLPRAFHNALLELSSRTNSDERFRQMLRPTLNGIKGMVQDAVQREVETLLDNYGTEYWDGRDVTYDNLIWGTSGIEVPIKRILFQVELVMQDAVSKFIRSERGKSDPIK